MISAILFISFFIFLILGIPIGICLGLSSICAILYSGTSLTIVATNMYSGISKFLLLAIPFFYLWKFKTGLLKPAVIGTLRMIIQLFFIGMYLKYLFLWNNPWINFL